MTVKSLSKQQTRCAAWAEHVRSKGAGAIANSDTIHHMPRFCSGHGMRGRVAGHCALGNYAYGPGVVMVRAVLLPRVVGLEKRFGRDTQPWSSARCVHHETTSKAINGALVVGKVCSS
jgi:hypothetical protein